MCGQNPNGVGQGSLRRTSIAGFVRCASGRWPAAGRSLSADRGSPRNNQNLIPLIDGHLYPSSSRAILAAREGEVSTPRYITALLPETTQVFLRSIEKWRIVPAGIPIDSKVRLPRRTRGFFTGSNLSSIRRNYTDRNSKSMTYQGCTLVN